MNVTNICPSEAAQYGGRRRMCTTPPPPGEPNFRPAATFRQISGSCSRGWNYRSRWDGRTCGLLRQQKIILVKYREGLLTGTAHANMLVPAQVDSGVLIRTMLFIPVDSSCLLRCDQGCTSPFPGWAGL